MSNSLQTSLHGKRFGLSPKNNLVSNDIQITQPCVDATIAVSAEGNPGANQRAVTIQLLDANGNDIEYQEIVDVFVTGAANLDAIAASAGSPGIEAGTDGAILATVVAQKHFVVASENDGDIDLTWTDTGTDVAYLALRLPTGRVIFSDALTNS